MNLFNTSKENNTKFSHCRKACEKFLEKVPVQIFLTIFTVIALYGDDMRFQFYTQYHIYFPVEMYIDVDLIYLILILTCFLVFLAEFMLSIVVIKGYTLSFFFWLDLVSLLSLLSDILIELLGIQEEM